MPKVIANNITMNYERQGTGEPLILIPYLAADNACYAFQVAEYAKHFTCISLDLRGTGESDKPQGAYTTELLADDVAAFMEAIGIEKAHVSGLSLGGAIGLWLAAKHPDKVQSLSLHSSWAKSDLFQKTVIESWQIWRRRWAFRTSPSARSSRGALRRSCTPKSQTTSTRWRRSCEAARRRLCRTSCNSRTPFSLTTSKHAWGQFRHRRRLHSVVTIS